MNCPINTMNKLKILTIGGATQDIFINSNEFESKIEADNQESYLLLKEGSKVDIKECNYYSGGGATNSAVSFVRLGFNVSTIFKLGKDCQADFILNDLKKENIDTSNVVYSDSLSTAISIIFPCPSGDRVVLAHRGANKDLDIQDFSLEIIKNYDAIYITSLSAGAAKIFFDITHYAKENNIFVAANPGVNQFKTNIEDFKKSLRNIDVLTLNNSEAQELYTYLTKDKSYTIKNYFKEVSKLGPKIIAVTDGSKGAYAYCDNIIYFHPSIEPEKIVNTLGAGDAFGSCFVANILQNISIEESMILGIINSASVIGHQDAQTGLLNKDQLFQKRMSLKINLYKN